MTHKLGGTQRTSSRATFLARRWCRAKSAQTRQPRPDSGPGSQVKTVQTFQVAPSLLGSGTRCLGSGFDRVINSRTILRRNVQRFRGGLIFKVHRLVCHSTLGWSVIKMKKKSLRAMTHTTGTKRAFSLSLSLSLSIYLSVDLSISIYLSFYLCK